VPTVDAKVVYVPISVTIIKLSMDSA
jgi:hypothetical protein